MCPLVAVRGVWAAALLHRAEVPRGRTRCPGSARALGLPCAPGFLLQQRRSRFLDRDPLFRRALGSGPPGGDGVAGLALQRK